MTFCNSTPDVIVFNTKSLFIKALKNENFLSDVIGIQP